MINTKQYIPLIIEASRNAGIKILEIYNSDDYEIEKKNDNTPVTRADYQANAAIIEKLEKTEWPILSEESKIAPYEQRKDWETYWLVDPLDGTKEFIKKNGEFTVNIALIHQNIPILGVVHAPVKDKIYFGGIGHGAYMDENMNPEHQLKLIKNKTDTVKILVSRSHLNQKTKDFIAQYDDPQLVSMGSSLKFMQIVENKAEIYPRFGRTMEWDTAAAHAILKALGVEITSFKDNKPLHYNKKDLSNPDFIVKR